ncbi:hypothetical protein JXA40_11495 [bacterium]|nr:hypothetical protein [candidate division CSSED10-310 bacterium]
MISAGFKAAVLGILLTAVAAETATGADLNARVRECVEIVRSGENPVDTRDCLERLAGYLKLIEPDDITAREIRECLEGVPEERWTPFLQAALGSHYLKTGNPDKASEMYLDLILSFPSDPKIMRYRIALAEAFRMSGNYIQAAAQLEPLLESRSTESAWAILEMARLNQSRGLPDKALENYRKIELQAAGTKVAEIARRESREIRLNQWAM